MQKHEDNLAARINGNALQPLAGASVTVTDDATGLPAALYSDDGVTPLAQPIITGNEGQYAFYAANGEYTVTFSGTRFATFTRKVILADPSDNPYLTQAAAAAPTGAALIGHGSGTVADVLDANVATQTKAQGLVNNTFLRSGERAMIIAHRGFDSTYPQNTILAISSAIQAGADGIEVDISFSSDGVPYVFHDETVDALTTGTGAFTSLTAAAIDALRFDALAGSIFADEPIPRFSEVLELCRKEGVPLFAELKNMSSTAQISVALQAIIDADMLALTSLQSGALAYVEMIRDLNADINVGFITADAAYAAYVDTLAALGNASVVAQHDMVFANPAMVDYCRSKAVDLTVYTIPDTLYLNRVARLGVTKFMCSRYARGNR